MRDLNSLKEKDAGCKKVYIVLWFTSRIATVAIQRGLTVPGKKGHITI
uniref:Uncharacterized protein n=1 Tax=Anguilla anguilla TaxID=7936 RepID=A0A0E9U3D9_ANGAN